jgi:hypothetical protein
LHGYSNDPSFIKTGCLNYTEEWREQALRSSGNLPLKKGKVPIPATSDNKEGNYNLNRK